MKTLACTFVAALAAVVLDRVLLRVAPDERQLCMLTLPDGDGGAKIVPLRVDAELPSITARPQ